MKEGIHPNYHEVEARCACGATWKTKSTKKELHLEICSNCHPFFTGRQKLMDTEGRVQRFTKKFGAQTVASRKKPAAANETGPARQEDKQSRYRVDLSPFPRRFNYHIQPLASGLPAQLAAGFV